jgi:hypothetical protein
VGSAVRSARCGPVACLCHRMLTVVVRQQLVPKLASGAHPAPPARLWAADMADLLAVLPIKK